MSDYDDKYAARAFDNISDLASGAKRIKDPFDVIAAYFNVKNIDDNEDKEELLAEKYDIRARKIKLDSGWYRNSAMPMLAQTQDGQKAVIPNSFGGCSYYDNGRLIKITKKNADMFTGDAVCYYKGFGNGKISTGGFLKYISDIVTVKDKITVVVMSILVTLTGMIFPFANYMIFNYIIPSGTLGDIMPVAALLIGVTGTIAISLLMQMTVLSNIISKVGVYVQGALFSRLMRLKAEFFKTRNAGELSETITEFADIGSMISAQSLTTAIGLVLSWAYLVQMYKYAPSLIWVVLAIAVIIILLAVYEAVLFIKWKQDYTRSSAGLTGMVYEAFSVIEKIKLNGAATRIFERWSVKYRESILKREQPVGLRYSGVFSEAVSMIALICIFAIGVKSKMPMANYIAFNAAYGSFIAAISGVSIVLESAAAFISSFKLLKPVLDADTEVAADKKTISGINGEIEFSNVKFKYAQDLPYVLKGISLRIKSGESVGIVGSSGCGKSTLLRLLLGFEDLKEGGIFIDGTDLREIDMRSYRSKLGIVLQDSRLLNDDIYSNITITAPDADEDDVWEAVESAGLLEDIENMPMGLRTIVSEENSTISGGQKQRIIIARALIGKPSLIVFDEATSALDNVTQMQITKAVDNMEATRIIIAHRLSTIRNCDRIVYLHDGVIVEEGSYDELMDKKGYFYNMAKYQIA